MKRILPVLLGALTGLVVLPIAMFACATATHFLFPKFFLPIQTAGMPVMLLSGIILGEWSVVLWRGERKFGSRFGSAVSATGINAYFVLILAQEYKQVPTSLLPMLREDTAFLAPLLLWSFGLFFVAVLARRRATSGLL